MRGPTASIALATYNGADHLAQQLDSIAGQSVKPIEIVVGDDGSSDDTIGILEAFAGRAGFPVSIHRNPGQFGYRRNFMEIASRCTGDVVFFSDQDDVWYPDKIARVLREFDDPHVQLAYHNAVVVDGALRPICPLYRPKTERRLIAGDPFHLSLGFTQAYRRDLNRFAPLWDGTYDHIVEGQVLAHDQWFMLMASLIGRVAFVGEPLADYRQHGRNVFGAAGTRKSDAASSGLRQRVFGVTDASGGRAVAAADRARIAAGVAGMTTGAEARQAERVAARYRRLAARLARWHTATASADLSARLGGLRDNLLDGAYSDRDPWRLRPEWIVGDLVRTIRGRRDKPLAWLQRQGS